MNQTAKRIILPLMHFSAYYLKLIVNRSRLCLDFAFTCYFIHLFATCIYSHGFPLSLSWWLIMSTASWITVKRGRALCLAYELLPISTTSLSSPTLLALPRQESHQPVGLFGWIRRGWQAVSRQARRSKNRKSITSPPTTTANIHETIKVISL